MEKLNKAVQEAFEDPKVKARLAELGGTTLRGTPEDFGNSIAAETEKWKNVVEFSGATVE